MKDFKRFKEELMNQTTYWYLAMVFLVLCFITRDVAFDIAFWGLMIMDLVERKHFTVLSIPLPDKKKEEEVDESNK